MKNVQNVIAKPDVKKDTIGMPQRKPVILNVRQVINMMNLTAQPHRIIIVIFLHVTENTRIATNCYILNEQQNLALMAFILSKIIKLAHT